jgi:hypothetical protein
MSKKADATRTGDPFITSEVLQVREFLQLTGELTGEPEPRDL